MKYQVTVGGRTLEVEDRWKLVELLRDEESAP